MEKIKCKYIFKDDFNPIYTNGAQGGITSQGEIVANFYLERQALPVSQTYNLQNDRLAAEESQSEPNDLNKSFVRVIENGVIMNYKTAKEIHHWLGLHIAKLEETVEELKETVEESAK